MIRKPIGSPLKYRSRLQNTRQKDAHSIHCMRSEKIYTGIHGMLCSFTFHLPLHLNYRINPERPTVKDWSRTQDQDFAGISSPVSSTIKWKRKKQ